MKKYWKRINVLLITAIAGGCLSESSQSAVNVYGPTPQLETSFIQDTTNQYKATVTKGAFANTYTINLISRNATVIPPADPKIITLDSVSNKLVAISTVTFVDGFALGMEYERTHDESLATEAMLNCETPGYFNELSVPVGVNIDSTTCNIVAGGVSLWISQQTSGTVLVPDIIH